MVLAAAPDSTLRNATAPKHTEQTQRWHRLPEALCPVLGAGKSHAPANGRDIGSRP
jgi:hypothetical protein